MRILDGQTKALSGFGIGATELQIRQSVCRCYFFTEALFVIRTLAACILPPMSW